MSYKSEFASNNADLQTILDVVNGLPDKAETVTITLLSGRDMSWISSIGSVTYKGTTYTTPTTFTAKVGDTILISAPTLNYDSQVLVNGEVVVAENPLNYTYTVVSDAVFDMNSSVQDFYVYIDELPAINFVEYLESTGTQYIDTGLYPTQNTRVVMDVQLTSATSTSNQWLFCGRKAAKNSVFGFYHYNGYFGAGYGSEQVDQLGSMDALTRLNIDFNKNVLKFNGVSQTFTEQTFTSTGALCLLARNTAGTIAAKASAKLYSCKVYENGVLVRDYRPCQHHGSLAPGLFDMVNFTHSSFSNSPTRNAGTGAFTAGPSVQNTSTSTSTTSTFAPTDSGGTTYKSKFADNNVDLQKILDKVNSL